MTFLEQLQQSAGLLSNDIASVGTYNRFQPSDFLNGIPQNKFVGNQFLMPSGGQFSSMNEGLLNYSPGSLTYTPQPFQSNYFQNVPMTTSGTGATQTSQERGGGENRPSPEDIARQQQRSGLINEFKKNPYLSSMLDPTISPTVFGLLSGFLDDSYGALADDVLASTSFVDDIADSAYTGSSGTGNGGKPSTPGGFKSPSFSDVETGKFSGPKGDGPKGDGPGKGGPTGPGGTTSGPPGKEGPGR
jgi:hypothetical protein